MNKPRCANHKDRPELPRGCKTCVRIELEQDILKRTVAALFAAKLNPLRVNNGADDDLGPFNSEEAVLAACMDTDDERIFTHDNRQWVYFVYGNDGWDVICDYTVGLEEALKPVFDYIKTIEP